MGNRTKFKVIGVAAVVAVLSSQPVLAEDVPCARASDVDAFVIRDLQSQLMVAGLACGQRAAYNSFVTIHEKELGRAGRRLKDYFKSKAEGVRSLDRHVTDAANAASRLHSKNRQAFCAQTAQLFRELLGESARSITNIARTSLLKSVAKPVACMAKAPTTVDAFNQTN